MAFPTSPVDGQKYTTSLGSVYEYVAADNKWIKAGIDLGVTGPAGDSGATGLQGETGSQGINGDTGPQGLTGLHLGITGVMNIVFDGGGAEVTSGIKADVNIPFSMNLYQWRLTAGQTGSLLVGLWKDSYDNFPPTSGDALHSGATGPSLDDEIKNQDTDLSDWDSTLVTPNDVLRVNVDSIETITFANLALFYTKS